MRRMIQGLLLFCILTGCQTVEPQQNIRPMQLSTNAVINQEQADEAKQIVLSMEEVTEVKGVQDEHNIYLAPKIKHFDRFRLKEIRKYGHNAVKKRYPDATVHISTDQKIFMELEKLEIQLKNKTISEKRLKEKLKKLDEMMRG